MTEIIDTKQEIIENIRTKNTLQRAKNARKEVSWLEKLNLKQRVNNHKLARVWAYRNHDHAEVFANSLELDYIIFQQELFLEDTKDLSAKLTRIGFTELTGYPDEELFKGFTRVMYNKKYNIAISLYDPKHKHAIKTANKIVEKSFMDGRSGMAIFLATIEVLLEQ